MDKKRPLLAAVTLVSFAWVALAFAAEPVPVDVKGIDWLQMSIGDRREQVFLSMAVLGKNQVPMQGDLYSYYNALLGRIEHDPGQYQRRLTWILADYVYENEPASRPIIDSLRRPTA